MDQAIQFAEVGGPEMLRVAPITLASPGPGEALIRHTAIGLNFIDTYHRSGLYPVPLPSGLGLEAAGVVEAVGDGVGALAPGDRVGYCWGPIGAYATRRLIKADMLVSLPDTISDEAAAAMLLKGCTAEYLIRRCAPVKAGDVVLVHAAAGGVGLILGQWLAALGVTAIGAASSAEKRALALAHGYAHAIDYVDVAAQVRALTDDVGVSVVYDGVGKDTWAASLKSCAPRGTIVSFGNASGPVPPIELSSLAAHGGLFVTRPSLFHYYSNQTERSDGVSALFEQMGAGHITPRIDQRFALADAADAHRALEARTTTGASLLLP